MAVYFIINPFLADSFDVSDVWYVLDVLMAIGLALALAFGYVRKREECGRDPGGAVTRRYLEVNVVFYLTAGVAILFLHNWFSLLAEGSDSLDGNHQAWIIWAAVDTMPPLAEGVAILAVSASSCPLGPDSSASLFPGGPAKGRGSVDRRYSLGCPRSSNRRFPPALS